MALIDDVPPGARVALDTPALIYFVERHDAFGPVVRPVFDAISRGVISGVVSAVTLLEVLVGPLRQGNHDLAEEYRRRLLNTRGLILRPVDASVADDAASLRAMHNLTIADALVAATAVAERCSHLVTNDAAFRRVPSFLTLVASDFAGG